jgi:hypothetical protein
MTDVCWTMVEWLVRELFCPGMIVQVSAHWFRKIFLET